LSNARASPMIFGMGKYGWHGTQILNLARRIVQAGKLLLLALLLIGLVAPEWPAFGGERYRLQTIVQQRQFDYLVWEAQALAEKGRALLVGYQRYLDEPARKQLVLDYLVDVEAARRLEAEIERAYADPTLSDPIAATRGLQSELRSLRAGLQARQWLVEVIVQEQVGAVLAEEGFAVLGMTWPPVLMHVTQLPRLLVVSPRDRIERAYAISLQPQLTTPVHEEMETAVTDHLNLSALVVPLGGVGLYPSMILETSSIYRLVEVVAHEWAHNWLTLKPLGIRYEASPALRIINETVASIIDVEIADLVMARYYPEFARQPSPPLAAPSDADPPRFDFRAAMAATRIRVDELLAAGEIEAAEAYMEARRQLFLANGYNIRKLNQAYFAFYGAYAAEPGATGADPIGPMLRDIRAQSPSLRAFMDTVAVIRSEADLTALHARLP
jgi:hypothetical protein